MQTFCTCELVSIAPYSYYVASMLAQMISVSMTNNDLIKLVLAVIYTVEQSLV